MLRKVYLVFDGSLTSMCLFIRALRTRDFVILLGSLRSKRFNEQKRIVEIARIVYGFTEANDHVIFSEDPLRTARLLVNKHDVLWNLDELLIEPSNQEIDVILHDEAFETVYDWLEDALFPIFDLLSDCTAEPYTYCDYAPLAANCGSCPDCVAIWDLYAEYYSCDAHF